MWSMTDEEIRIYYRDAKSKEQAFRYLLDFNPGTKPQELVEVLQNLKFDLTEVLAVPRIKKLLTPRAPSKLTAEQRLEIYNRHEAGESSRELAKEFGCVKQTILNICNAIKAQQAPTPVKEAPAEPAPAPVEEPTPAEPIEIKEETTVNTATPIIPAIPEDIIDRAEKNLFFLKGFALGYNDALASFQELLESFADLVDAARGND